MIPESSTSSSNSGEPARDRISLLTLCATPNDSATADVIEQSKSAGRGDHRPLGKFLGITSQGRGFQPAKEDARRIDGVHSWSGGDYSISNGSALLHEVQRMPIGKERVQSFMGIERNDVWLHAAHALEGTRRAAMQSGIGSANSSVLQRGRQCVEPLFF